MAGIKGWRRLSALMFTAVVQLATASAAAPPAAVEGVWLTDTRTEMTIAACPQGYCGYISKIVVPERIRKQVGTAIDEIDPSQFTDVNNKDPRLKTRPIQGLQILTLKPTGNANYYEGEIYNPEDGNIYAGSVEVMAANSIRLKGCVLYVLCQEQLWARVPPPPPELTPIAP